MLAAGEASEEKRLTPTAGEVILHRVYSDGAWSDIWIDRQRGHEYAQVIGQGGEVEYIFMGPLD